MDWIENEYGSVNIGDQRLNKWKASPRVVKVGQK